METLGAIEGLAATACASAEVSDVAIKRRIVSYAFQ
jgi:hypothetical protein